MSNEIKKELTPYYIELKSDITPKQYLDSNEGASIKNDSIIFFIRDNEEIEISKRIRDIWIKDSEGITHLMSGYGRFFLLTVTYYHRIFEENPVLLQHNVDSGLALINFCNCNVSQIRELDRLSLLDGNGIRSV